MTETRPFKYLTDDKLAQTVNETVDRLDRLTQTAAEWTPRGVKLASDYLSDLVAECHARALILKDGAMDVTSSRPKLTDTLTHRAEALRGEIDMATREGWSATRIAELKADRAAVLDQLHTRAIADDNADEYATAEFAVTETADLNTLLAVNATLPRTWLTGHRASMVLAELRVRAEYEAEQRGMPVYSGS